MCGVTIFAVNGSRHREHVVAIAEIGIGGLFRFYDFLYCLHSPHTRHSQAHNKQLAFPALLSLNPFWQSSLFPFPEMTRRREQAKKDKHSTVKGEKDDKPDFTKQ